MCKFLKVSKNSYYRWNKCHGLPKIKHSKQLLMQRIKSLFYENQQIYGSYRIHKMLEREGLFYSRSYVGFLMREMNLKSILKRKYIVTTDSKHALPIAMNVLERNFSSLVPGEKWVSDITYIRISNSWGYLTTIMDLADRKIVGWTLSDDMAVENTILKAWLLARRTRKITNNHIFHSDRGVQYASKKMTNLLTFSEKSTQSMSRKANCWDNAVAESFFKTIKYECLNRCRFDSYQQTYECINAYIKWYNTKRIHSSLGYLTPLEKEMELRKLMNNVA